MHHALVSLTTEGGTIFMEPSSSAGIGETLVGTRADMMAASGVSRVHRCPLAAAHGKAATTQQSAALQAMDDVKPTIN